MRTLLQRYVALTLMPCATVYSQGIERAREVTLVDPPVIRLADGGALEISKAEIKELIRSFSEISEQGFGFSSTYAGSAFAPLEGSESMGTMILMRHEAKTPDSLKRIVEVGPLVLPWLLERLTDSRPTNLTVALPFRGMGIMYFAHEIYPNPVNQHEATVLKTVTHRRGFEHERPIPEGEYTLTVGDICFVAIGQITNRRYSAARYQPTGCVMINSPVEDAELASEVRAIWQTEDHRQKLLDSLVIDLCTRGRSTYSLQTGAATRLLYYFPNEARPLLVERLRKLDVTTTDFFKRAESNGVSEADFVKAVAWTPDPTIRAELASIMRKATIVDVVINSMPALDATHDVALFEKLTALLDRLPPDEPGPYGNGYKLLGAIGSRFPEHMKRVFHEYLKDAGLQRRRSMCHALRKAGGELATDLLAPFLDDKSHVRRTYAVNPGENEPRLPLRVCDEAAETIAACRPDVSFTLAGTHEHLDRQITAMKERLGNR